MVEKAQERASIFPSKTPGRLFMLQGLSTPMNPIRDHPFFTGLHPAHVNLLIQNAHTVEYGADEVLFSEGEPASQFFLIESGLVAVETGAPDKGVAVMQAIGAGEPLGWSWLFPPFTWHFRARALQPTRAYILDAGSLLVLCEENHSIGYELMRRISQLVILRMETAIKKIVG